MPAHPSRWSLPPLGEPEETGGGNPFVLVGTIVAAKLTTIVVVLTVNRSSEVGAFVAATTWHWALVLAALLAAPLAFALRLRRVRARRGELLHGEWQIESSTGLPTAPNLPGRSQFG